jgi:hypothetical protein
MARIEWVEHRLQNWARWKLSECSGPLGFASVKLEERVDQGGGYEDAPIPINAIEAAATDAVLRGLTPRELYATVYEVYCGRGGIKDKARRLGCAEATVHARVGQAHLQMAREFTERNRAAAAERARVEKLQAAMRP